MKKRMDSGQSLSLRDRQYRFVHGWFLFALIFLLATASPKAGSPADAFNLQNGIIDPNFNPSVGGDATVMDSVRQSDGKLIIVGAFNSVNGRQQINIARLFENGELDSSFVPPVINENIYKIALQSDGKILISYFTTTGTSASAKIFRLNPDGSIDPSFYTGPGTSGLIINAITVLSNGYIMIGGEFSSYNGVNRHGLYRLNPDGTVDDSYTTETADFGNSITSIAEAFDGSVFIGGRFSSINGISRSGIAKLDPDGAVVQTFNADFTSIGVNQLLPTADGKIYGCGNFSISGNTMFVARFNADGSIDNSFTPDARTNYTVRRMQLHPDGRLFIFGDFLFPSTPGAARAAYLLNTNGSIVESFVVSRVKTFVLINAAYVQNDGKITLSGNFQNINGSEHISLLKMNANFSIDETYRAFLVGKNVGTSMAVVQPDGKILLAGVHQFNEKWRFWMGRLNADGTTDSEFNQTDVFYYYETPTLKGILLQPDGKIIVYGTIYRVDGLNRPNIARLNADGTVDESFFTNDNGMIFCAALQADGKIIIGGQFTSVNSLERKAVARLNADGSIDPSFDAGSLLGSSTPQEIIVQPDNKILLSGVRNTAETLWRTLVRLNPDGSRDTAFNPILNFTTPDIELEPDGKIFVAGGITTVNGQPRNGLARLHPDGSLDTSFTGEIAGGGIRCVTRLSDGRYLVGGSFSQIQSTPRAGLARFNADGTLDASFFEGFTQNGAVLKILSRPGGKILISGSFTTFNNLPRTGLVQLLTSRQTIFDFDGDGQTDVSIYRPSVGEWWINKSGGGGYAAQFGAATDKITPGDFTGDGKTDIAFFRPLTGEWYVLRSEDASYYSFPFGTNEDIPFVGDFDADGKADNGVFRPSSATWFIRKSSDGSSIIRQFGQNGDMPVVADYDGDGVADIAIYRVSLGEWWINRSTAGLIAFQFGNSTDKSVQGDYTGDGKADVAFFKPSTGEWFVLRSENQSYYSFPFGANGDAPTPGDYDGDGKIDAAVFRPSNNTWFINKSTGGNLIQTFGQNGDRPLPNAFVP